MMAVIWVIKYFWIIDSYFKLLATAVAGSLVFLLFVFIVALNVREKEQMLGLIKRKR